MNNLVKFHHKKTNQTVLINKTKVISATVKTNIRDLDTKENNISVSISIDGYNEDWVYFFQHDFAIRFPGASIEDMINDLDVINAFIDAQLLFHSLWSDTPHQEFSVGVPLVISTEDHIKILKSECQSWITVKDHPVVYKCYKLHLPIIIYTEVDPETEVTHPPLRVFIKQYETTNPGIAQIFIH